jgi:type I restriction enzyme R subunit
MYEEKIIIEQEHQTVMAHYEVEAKPDGGYQSEVKLSMT